MWQRQNGYRAGANERAHNEITTILKGAEDYKVVVVEEHLL